jgi:plasmid stabilization system protein ParE
MFPLIGRLYRSRYRRLLIPRYPFGIFYVVESNRIVIHAVLDLRQDPKKIRERFVE